MQVDLAIVPEAKCAAVPEYAGFLGDGVICAGSSVPGRDSCNGDSGGPLTRAQGPERVLVGLVSWGKGCGLASVPGLYTNVAHYARWISDAMKAAPAGRLSRM
jgi:trypsin